MLDGARALERKKMAYTPSRPSTQADSYRNAAERVLETVPVKKARTYLHKTPAWVESHPRVIDARRRWERGEMSISRMTRIRKMVAGICVRCSGVAVAKKVCAKHLPAERKKQQAARKRAREVIRLEKNARAGIPITMHSVKSCSKCGMLRKTAATCRDGVHR